MEDQWPPVIEKDVDGPHSLPLTLDRENPNLGRYSASRRVARTIYIGSAPIQRAANKGIDDRQVKLGCVQPGESVATFGDALRRLTDRATYLYVDGKRYWYSTQPTVARLAEDRAAQLDEHTVADEIVKRLRDEARSRGDFSKVHSCPGSTADVPDEPEARLVILGPGHRRASNDASTPARVQAATMLDSRGSSPRNYKNTLVFLAPDATRLRELQGAARQYLAWKSIWDDRESLNLDPFQQRQADTKLKTADDTVTARIPETYQWLIVPGQSDPKGQPEWNELRLSGQDGLAVRASKKLKTEELLMVQLGGTRLRHELDKVPLWRGDHVSLKQLAEDVARYLYLPRLRDEDVLLAAAMDGVSRLTWKAETFAYADAWDDKKNRYKGLRAGQSVRVLMDGQSLLVKPDAAVSQLDADLAQHQVGTTNGGTATEPSDARGGPDTRTTAVEPGGGGRGIGELPRPRRFHGAVKLDAIRLGRDASRIAEEVVQHLSGLVDAQVEITLEIHAEIPQGASPELVRTITENCRTLRFESHGFEET